MIETTKGSGDRGTLIVQDLTDGGNKSVDLWIQSSTTIAIAQLPWAYSIDNTMSNWASFNFQPVVTRQHLGQVYVGNAQKFTLHLGNTGTSAMGGPTDLQIDLIGYVAPKDPDPVVTMSIVPYVNVQGRWYPAQQLMMVDGQWKAIG